MEMVNEEQVGFHKGSLATLVKEREELIRLLQIVEQLINSHVKALKELGVDLEAEAKKAQETLKKKKLEEKIG
jgi:hypothetical protein